MPSTLAAQSPPPEPAAPPAAETDAARHKRDRRKRTRRMRRMYFVWAAMLVGAIVVLLVKVADPSVLAGLGLAATSLLTWTTLGVAVVAFGAEFMNSSLGMGYGTMLTPILLLFGYEPLQIVPAVLLSELLTRTTAGLLHHGAGNVSLRRGSRHLHVALVLVACSVIGACPAAMIATRIPSIALKAFIGGIVLAVGVVTLATLNRTFGFSWIKIAGLGIIAAFNKAASGGGYGPIVVGGQVVSGVEAKNAVGIGVIAKTVPCLIGVVTYAATVGIDVRLTLPLVIGAMGAVPLAVISVKAVSAKWLRIGIGVLTIILGLATLLKMAF